MTDNQFQKVREGLEFLVRLEREQYQAGIDRERSTGISGKVIKASYLAQHCLYVKAMNDSFKIFCETFNVPYEPIKSRLKI